jgi:hypothetical protein
MPSLQYITIVGYRWLKIIILENKAFDNKFKVFWCKIYILTIAVNFLGRQTVENVFTRNKCLNRGNFRSWYQWRLALPYLSQFDFSYFMSNYLIVLQYIVKYNKMSVRVGFNCNNMNFIWKNSLFWKYQQLRYLNCILIYTLNSSIIYVNKNKFIIVYNSLFCFASTSTHDENAQIHRKIFSQIWSQIWSKNLREPVVLTGRMKLTSIHTLNVSYNQHTVWNNWVETKIENRIK